MTGKTDNWFIYTGSHHGDGTSLNYWIEYTEFTSFRKGGKDKHDHNLIFLLDGKKTVGVIRATTQGYYTSALRKLRNKLEGNKSC